MPQTVTVNYPGGAAGTTIEIPDPINTSDVARKGTVLAADHTLTTADHGKTFIAGAADLTLTLGAASGFDAGFFCRVVIGSASVTTGFTIAGAINAGSTSAVNTQATEALGDEYAICTDATTWFGSARVGTWAVT
jgi:hypothetical protein